MKTVESMLGREAVEALFRPAAEARGLPGRAYTSEEFLALENERLFPGTWTAAGVASDIPNPGDAAPVTVAGLPLVLLRDRAGEVHAFYNVCRHRGMRVVTQKCSGLQAMRCLWHQWTYDLDGRLLATPNIGGVGQPAAAGFDRAELGLKPVRCGVWLNTVFVNLDGKAPPLAEHVKPFETYYGEYDFSLLRHGGYRDRTLEANWKLFVESGIEDYHLPWIHPQFFQDFGNWWGRSVVEGTMVGTESRIPGAAGAFSSGKPLPKFPHLGDGGNEIGNFMLIFPNIGISVTQDHVAVSLYQPVKADRTYYRKDFYFLGDAATDPELAATREQVVEGWIQINDQDQAFMTPLQANHAVRDRIGVDNRFTPVWESAVQRFQQMVVEGLRA
jgi:choline monooxygenase